ncbi:MAG TPA: hypothetical protein VK837_04820, partial [Longimicrobiales bacterium]|nr:hypothetical protein [Longimicrobiales bacterium]
MPHIRQIIREIHRRSLWQVLAVYLVSGWVVLQVVDTLAGALGLPDWASPLALFLLIVGLPIVLATAFVQEGSGVPAEPGTAPSAADADAPTAHAPSFLRQLTWRRALLGGVVAFSLLFGVAGAFVLFGGGAAEPTADAASDAEPAVAVLPFTVRGQDQDLWREGMVDLLSPMIDGVAGLRAINSRTVLSRWSEGVGTGSPDLTTSLRVAREAGARFALIGSAVGSGTATRVELELYDADTGERLSSRRVEGESDDLMAITDRAAAEIARMALEALGRISDFELERLTDSPEALLAFLEGEVAFRSFDLIDAWDDYQRAVTLDSAFAFAHLRLVEVGTWGATAFRPTGEHLQAAARHIDRLTERSAMRVRALQATHGERQRLLREAVAAYPDDAVLWYELGESLIHTSAGFPSREEITEAFRKALELEPGRAATYPHVVYDEVSDGRDSARARILIHRFREVAGEVSGPYREDFDPRVGPYAHDLVFGDPDTRAAAVAAMDTLPPDFLMAATAYVFLPRHWEVLEPLLLAMARHPASGRVPSLFGSSALSVASRRLVIGYALWRGRPDRGLEYAGGETMALGPFASEAVGLPYLLHYLGLPVPEATLDAAFGPSVIDSVSHVQNVFLAGA